TTVLPRFRTQKWLIDTSRFLCSIHPAFSVRLRHGQTGGLTDYGGWQMSVRGGWLCGAVEFEADLPFSKFVRCHCSRCRNATGSTFSANAYVLPRAFRWLSGEDKVARFDLP